MILDYAGHSPDVHADVFLAPQSVLIGQVKLGSQCSVWFNAVLRGDNDEISIGARTNLQENVICHVDSGFPLKVGEDCVIGHAAVLHGCTLGNRVLIGIGAKVLNGAVIEDEVVVGAGTLVPEGARLQTGYLYLGVPAKQVRLLRPDELQRLKRGAAHYVEKGERYRLMLQG
ncbi:MAG: gamma carbonic anhydrase family protein [Candidatus Eremiobacteraeota bacterium]|nr:gamma carbonic anhydrase family protein [Candidatus Eremiobacteraeota bacterium]